MCKQNIVNTTMETEGTQTANPNRMFICLSIPAIISISLLLYLGLSLSGYELIKATVHWVRRFHLTTQKLNTWVCWTIWEYWCACERSRHCQGQGFPHQETLAQPKPKFSWCFSLCCRPNTILRLQFNHFATECSWDHLYVYDGDSIYAPLLAAFRWVCFRCHFLQKHIINWMQCNSCNALIDWLERGRDDDDVMTCWKFIVYGIRDGTRILHLQPSLHDGIYTRLLAEGFDLCVKMSSQRKSM